MLIFRFFVHSLCISFIYLYAFKLYFLEFWLLFFLFCDRYCKINHDIKALIARKNCLKYLQKHAIEGSAGLLWDDTFTVFLLQCWLILLFSLNNVIIGSKIALDLVKCLFKLKIISIYNNALQKFRIYQAKFIILRFLWLWVPWFSLHPSQPYFCNSGSTFCTILTLMNLSLSILLSFVNFWLPLLMLSLFNDISEEAALFNLLIELFQFVNLQEFLINHFWFY